MAGLPVDLNVSVATERSYLLKDFVSKWVGGGGAFDSLGSFEGIGKDTNLSEMVDVKSNIRKSTAWMMA